MQPQVANEVAQVTMDLNSVSEQIMAIRKQRRPVRLFYSETSAINKTNHMTEQFELFESLFFEGFPMAYATQNVIETQNHTNWDVIVVYKTEYVTDMEFNALQSYLDAGGTVVLDSTSSLAKNEYGQSRQLQLTSSAGNLIVVGPNSSYSKVRESALQQISSAENGIDVIENNGLGKNTTMWRGVKQQDNSYVVSMMNLGKNTSTLQLSIDGSSNLVTTNLLTNEDLTDNFDLAPNGVLILKIKSK